MDKVYREEDFKKYDKLMSDKGMVTLTEYIYGNNPLNIWKVHTGIKSYDDLYERAMQKWIKYSIMYVRNILDMSEMCESTKDFCLGKKSAWEEVVLSMRKIREESL